MCYGYFLYFLPSAWERNEELKRKSEVVYETRAISVWHMLIFIVLCFIMAIGVLAVLSGLGTSYAILFFFIIFGSLFSLFLYSVLFGKLKIYEDGIWFRLSHAYFEEIRLKCGGRLLRFERLNWFIVLNPREFVQAIEDVKPD